MMKEQWKWVPGYEGLYQISNHGRLKSYHKNPKGRILSAQNNSGWYLSHILANEAGEQRTRRIHVLVAEAFIGEIPSGCHVHHKDGNKQNNVVTNLEILNGKVHLSMTIRAHPERTAGMVHYNKYERPKRIRQYTLNGEFVAEYANAKIASEITGVCQRNILQVAAQTPFNSNGNIRKQAGGYIWKNADESEVMPCED